MEFIALGGANEVGANCYYINVADRHFLFDCGIGIRNGVRYGPDFTNIYKNIDSLSQIDAIFISHAHFDHIGFLPDIANMCRDTPIYATFITKEVGKHLMWDRVRYSRKTKIDVRIAQDYLTDVSLERIQALNFGKTYTIAGVKVTFYIAGHIPGAAMVYVETDEKNVLYTGDFMKKNSNLTPGYTIPKALSPDVIIMCGLHAKHPYYLPPDSFAGSAYDIAFSVNQSDYVYMEVQQLTNGIETVMFISKKMREGVIPVTNIFVDDLVWDLAERLGSVNIKALTENCNRFPKNINAPGKLSPGIYVGSAWNGKNFEYRLKTNFSLHCDYADCAELINYYAPSSAFIVHSPDDRYGRDNNALSEDCTSTNIIYPVVGRGYIC